MNEDSLNPKQIALKTFSFANGVMAVTPMGTVQIINVGFNIADIEEMQQAFIRAEKISEILNQNNPDKWLYLGILNYN